MTDHTDPNEKPTALQLAQIAAPLSHTLPPDEAVRKALVLWATARRFLARHGEWPSEDLIQLCENPNAFAFEIKYFQALKEGKPFRRFEPSKRIDEVRTYLSEGGLSLKHARAVRDNLVRYLNLDASTEYLKEKGIEVPAASSRPPKHTESKIASRAREAGWSKQSDPLAPFADHEVPGTYQIPTLVLGRLLMWKKSLKSSGGRKSVSSPQNKIKKRLE